LPRYPNLHLDGLVYERIRLGPTEGDGAVDLGGKLLQVVDRAVFSLQAYSQLADYLRREGRTRAADDVIHAARQKELAQERESLASERRRLDPLRGHATTYEWLRDEFRHAGGLLAISLNTPFVVLGMGRIIWIPCVAGGLLLFIGMFAFWGGLEEVRAPGEGPLPGTQRPWARPALSLAYSLDLFLPDFIDLQLVKRVKPIGKVRQAWRTAHKVLGRALTLLLLAAVTGVIK
jgi:hypothetical protein